MSDEREVEHLRLNHPLKPGVPRLYYFDARGRAEIIRLLFAVKNIEYEDIRCRPHPHAMEDFITIKRHKILPFGQLPLLELDNLSLAQSQAILRYFGKKYDLVGDTEEETALVDMLGCAVEDIGQKFTNSILNWKDVEAQPFVCKFKNETCPQWGEYFERLLKKNGGIWFVGKRLTYADLAVYAMITQIKVRIPDAFNQFPLLKNHSDRIRAVPEIAAWLIKHPDNTL